MVVWHNNCLFLLAVNSCLECYYMSRLLTHSFLFILILQLCVGYCPAAWVGYHANRMKATVALVWLAGVVDIALQNDLDVQAGKPDRRSFITRLRNRSVAACLPKNWLMLARQAGAVLLAPEEEDRHFFKRAKCFVKNHKLLTAATALWTTNAVVSVVLLVNDFYAQQKKTKPDLGAKVSSNGVVPIVPPLVVDDLVSKGNPDPLPYKGKPAPLETDSYLAVEDDEAEPETPEGNPYLAAEQVVLRCNACVPHMMDQKKESTGPAVIDSSDDRGSTDESDWPKSSPEKDKTQQSLKGQKSYQDGPYVVTSAMLTAAIKDWQPGHRRRRKLTIKTGENLEDGIKFTLRGRRRRGKSCSSTPGVAPWVIDIDTATSDSGSSVSPMIRRFFVPQPDPQTPADFNCDHVPSPDAPCKIRELQANSLPPSEIPINLESGKGLTANLAKKKPSGKENTTQSKRVSVRSNGSASSTSRLPAHVGFGSGASRF